MVSMLHRKLLRDLFHIRGQAIAIAMIVACGVMAWVTMRGAYESLVATQRGYYTDYRFAHVFASLKRAPDDIAWRIRAIRGVAGVRTRVVADVTVDMPNLADPVTARILSIPPQRRSTINDLHLRAGRYIDPARGDEVLISASFAKANSLVPGDSIGAIMNGRWRRLRICGIAISPEYIIAMRGGFPDNRRFGILWMNHDQLAPAMGLDGSFNDVSIVLAPGADERDVIRALDRVLAPYGGQGAYGRDEQRSHQQIRDEIAQDRVSATTLPAIFLAVSIFLIHLVLRRLVASQRDQIATLKAFGYSNGAVAMHYLEMTLVIVVTGLVLGIPVALWLGRELTVLYTEFFDFPYLAFRISGEAIALSAMITLAASAVASFGAVRRVIALPPAEGMRGEAPPRFGHSVVDRWAPLKLVSAPVRMIVRTMQRRPLRTLSSIAGLAMAAMILVVGQYAFDALDEVIDLFFSRAQTDDATVVFTNPQSDRALADLRRMPGVTRVEGFRAVPVRIRFGASSRRTILYGLVHDARLRKLVGADGSEQELPLRGVVVTAKLAELLAARPGDLVTIEALEGTRPVQRMRIAATVDELIGTAAYLPLAEVNRFLVEGRSVSGANLAVDPNRATDLYSVLKRTPAVATVFLRAAMINSWRETIRKNIAMSSGLIVSFACIIAFGVIYNAARVALSERGRELASLRVLGFSHAEVALMLIGEQMVLTVASIPIGFAAGRALSAAIAASLDSEAYRLPVVISARTYAISFLIVAVAAAFSALVVQRRIRRLDLVEVLKARE